MTDLQNLDELLAGLEAEKAEKTAALQAAVAQQVPFSIAHTAVDPVTGEVREYKRDYVARPPINPRFGYTHEVLDVRPDGSVLTNWSVSTTNLEWYKAELLAKMIAEGEKWIRDMAWMREQNAAVARYQTELRPLLIKRGFKDNDDPRQEHGDRFLLQVFDALVEHDYQRYIDVAAYMTAEYKTDGAFRKAMREVVTSGKENAREEYPEQYREEEDKDEFYEEYLNEVLDGAFFIL